MSSYQIFQCLQKLISYFKKTSWGTRSLEDLYLQWSKNPNNHYRDFKYSSLYSEEECAMFMGNLQDELSIVNRCIFYTESIKEVRKRLCYKVNQYIKSNQQCYSEIHDEYNLTQNDELSKFVLSLLKMYCNDDECDNITLGIITVRNVQIDLEEWEQLALSLANKITIFDIYIQFYLWYCNKNSEDLNALINSIDIFYINYIGAFINNPFGKLNDSLTMDEKLKHSIFKYMTALVEGINLSNEYPELIEEYFDSYTDPYTNNDFINGVYSEKYVQEMQAYWNTDIDDARIRIHIFSRMNNIVKAYDIFQLLYETLKMYSDTDDIIVFTNIASELNNAYRNLIHLGKVDINNINKIFSDYDYAGKINQQMNDTLLLNAQKTIQGLSTQVDDLKNETQSVIILHLEFIKKIVDGDLEMLLNAKQNIIAQYQNLEENENLESLLNELYVQIWDKLNAQMSQSQMYSRVLNIVNADFNSYIDINHHNVLSNPQNADLLKSLVSAECLYNTYISNNVTNLALADYSGISLLYYCSLEGAINHLVYAPYRAYMISNGIVSHNSPEITDYLGRKPRNYYSFAINQWKTSCELGSLGHLLSSNPPMFVTFLNNNFGCSSLQSIGEKIINADDGLSKYRNCAAHGTEIIQPGQVTIDKEKIYINDSNGLRGIIKELFDTLYQIQN